jgi:hypothetical protein
MLLEQLRADGKIVLDLKPIRKAFTLAKLYETVELKLYCVVVSVVVVVVVVC